MSILIVDDNPVNRRFLELLLQHEGYQTINADGATAALAILTATADPIDVILVDFMMPDMNGLELITKLRGIARFEEVPIILMSAYTDRSAVSAAQALKCTDIFAKPVNKKALLTKLQFLMKPRPAKLRDKHQIMAELDASEEEYTELMTLFLARINTALPCVILEQGAEPDAISPQLEQLLKELWESAALLGAEEFISLYTSLKKKRPIARCDCATLQQALQTLVVAAQQAHAIATTSADGPSPSELGAQTAGASAEE